MNRFGAYLVCFVLVLSLCGCNYQIEELENAETNNIEVSKLLQAKVVKVTDGDTVTVKINGVEEKLRLIGINTPELHHPQKGVEVYGQEAYEYTKGQLLDEEVKLEFDVEARDRYNRLLGYIWIGQELYNEQLVREGYAQIMTVPPNVKYVEELKQAQTIAYNEKRGLWGIKDYSTEQQLVGSKKSTKYHLQTCKYALKIPETNLVRFKSQEDALNHGYEPCRVCNP